ncbi:MAG: HD domain-containing protein [Alphaproteobacteria bacterium]|nr:HD domain-containing protein [Alphaproteobacteria bacterium]
MSPIETITEIMTKIGEKRYGDESVSQLDHALQCAAFAVKECATAELVTAALLHDIGHCIDHRFEGAAAAGIDRRHEAIGAAYLSQWFGEAVTQPILLHVAAKQYLCTVEPEYYETLSPASIQSLELQGGLNNGFSVAHFLEDPWAADAVRLRRWDDKAKDPTAKTDGLDAYLQYAAIAYNRANVA